MRRIFNTLFVVLIVIVIFHLGKGILNNKNTISLDDTKIDGKIIGTRVDNASSLDDITNIFGEPVEIKEYNNIILPSRPYYKAVQKVFVYNDIEIFMVPVLIEYDDPTRITGVWTYDITGPKYSLKDINIGDSIKTAKEKCKDIVFVKKEVFISKNKADYADIDWIIRNLAYVYRDINLYNDIELFGFIDIPLSEKQFEKYKFAGGYGVLLLFDKNDCLKRITFGHPHL